MSVPRTEIVFSAMTSLQFYYKYVMYLHVLLYVLVQYIHVGSCH